jgi:hypothetical protein
MTSVGVSCDVRRAIRKQRPARFDLALLGARRRATQGKPRRRATTLSIRSRQYGGCLETGESVRVFTAGDAPIYGWIQPQGFPIRTLADVNSRTSSRSGSSSRPAKHHATPVAAGSAMSMRRPRRMRPHRISFGARARLCATGQASEIRAPRAHASLCRRAVRYSQAI